MRNWLITCWIFVCCLMIFTEVSSQIKIHRYLTVEDGLCQSQVTCMHEDRNGYLWIGTFNGISRWDGINFTNYHIYNGLSNEMINTIFEGKDGTLYFGTDGGVTIYKNNKFEIISKNNGLISNKVNAILESNNGTIYIGTSGGLNIYRNGKLETFNEHKKLAASYIKSIYQSNNNKLYFCTYGNGVFIRHVDQYDVLNKETGFISNNVTGIFESKDGSIYFNTDSGVAIYKNNKFSTFIRKGGLENYYISTLCEGYDGTLYFGTFKGGVFTYKDNSFDVINATNGLWSTYILSILKGNDGTMYFGTSGSGVCIYKREQFETFNDQTGLPSNIVMSIYEDHKGRMYFAIPDYGVSIYYEGHFDVLNREKGLISNRIGAILESKDGKIYFGTERNGVSVYHNNQFTALTKEDGLVNNSIRKIFESADGKILFGTMGGVSIYKDDKFKNLNKESGLSDNQISDIYESKDGKLFFATYSGGVCVFHNNQIEILDEKTGLANNSIFSIYEGKDSTMYFGTINGLSLYKNGKFNTIDVSDGLSDNTIMGILEDDEGRIYLSTNKGVNVLDFSKEKLIQKIILHGNGLASDECNEKSYFKDSKGCLWFGTIKGITRYNPKKDKPNTNPPKVHITRMRLFEKNIFSIPISDNLTFKHDENYFGFNFIGINLSDPKSVVYQYRLVGIDKNWVETSGRSVQYTNLDDGDYIFEVKAMNDWDYWSEPVKIAFTIQAPFWETWWFISLAILFIGGSVTYLVSNRIKQLLAIERLRTKIAADLHDNIGSGLTEISIISEVTSKNLKKGKNDTNNNLKKISDISRKLIDNMSDIVWLVNPKRDSLYDLIVRLKDTYAELLSYSGISFKTRNLKSLEKIALPMEYRHNLYLIFKEGINNCLKHSRCNEILLDANIDGKRLEMTLKDNGRGFDKVKVQSGNGLDNMIRRAKIINGNQEISSVLGKGTTIKFYGKISKLN